MRQLSKTLVLIAWGILSASLALADKPASSPQGHVYLFLSPIEFKARGHGAKDELTPVITRLLQAKFDEMEDVELKTSAELPGFPKILEKFGKVEELDRVSLLNIRNTTGFDGLIRFRYSFNEDDEVELEYFCVDFRNGTVFRKRELTAAVGSKLFQQIEADATEFAASVRRAYRVLFEIRSVPPGAEVLIDGKTVGLTPLTHEARTGTYGLEVRAERYKSFKQTYHASDGDRVAVDVALQNPIAAYYLNQRPAFAVDAMVFDANYQYGYLAGRGPSLASTHMLGLGFGTRLGQSVLGIKYSGLVDQHGEVRVDTFAGAGAGLQEYKIALNRLQISLRYTLWEKLSFLALDFGCDLGATYATADSSRMTRSIWSPAVDLYFEVASRVARNRQNTFEAVFGLGASYLGTLAYATRPYSLYGEQPTEDHTVALYSPVAVFRIRWNLWHDVL